MNTFEMAQLKEFSAKYTSPASHASVVADPDASVRYVIDLLMVSGDSAGTIQIEDSTNTAVPGYFFAFAAGVPVKVDGAFLKAIPLGKGFKLTTTGGGNHAVLIKYHPDGQGAP